MFFFPPDKKITKFFCADKIGGGGGTWPDFDPPKKRVEEYLLKYLNLECHTVSFFGLIIFSR